MNDWNEWVRTVARYAASWVSGAGSVYVLTLLLLAATPAIFVVMISAFCFAAIGAAVYTMPFW
jgi:hypothetical protein